jgi:hypothetical protein
LEKRKVGPFTAFLASSSSQARGSIVTTQFQDGRPFQTFKAFNRYAPFKTFWEFLKRRNEQQLVK